jgi:hypothetical protein
MMRRECEADLQSARANAVRRGALAPQPASRLVPCRARGAPGHAPPPESSGSRGLDPFVSLRDESTRMPSMTDWQVKDLTPKAWAKPPPQPGDLRATASTA